MNILYISFVDVRTKTGNHLREIQMLKYLSGKFNITYFNINSKNSDIIDYLTKNHLLIDIFQGSSFYLKYIRLTFKLNYFLNYLLCSKLNLYSNYKFFLTIGFSSLESYSKIFCFYSIPFHFLKLCNVKTKEIIIDTNDVMLNRHNLLRTRVWWSFSQKKESEILQKNTTLIYISSNDKDYYEKQLKFNHQSILIPFSLKEKKTFKIKANQKVTIGFIGSSNPFNLHSLTEILDLSIQNLQYEFIIAGTITDKIIRPLPKNVFVFSDKRNSIEFLNEFYKRLDLVYAPAHNKSGIKTKIIESLSFGIPVITNTNGYDKSLSILKNNGLFVIDKHNLFNLIVSNALNSDPRKNYLKYLKEVNKYINEINF
tara:strand:+ start:84 stop:1190 length:1107 start_codon:yes stop_codon:yes gene_type:complete